jgi:hypothetical protein
VSLTDRTAVVSFDISGMNDDEFAKGTVEAAVCPTPKS